MVSFIIIGKNEANNLKKCFDSIYGTVDSNNITNYEIIYVDSNSTDNSVETAKYYNIKKIFRLTGFCSPAVARNTGARYANGQALFFIDGDMEIDAGFYPHAFENHKLKHPFVTGNFIYHYANNRKTNYYKKPFTIKSLPFNNGTFVVEKNLWGLTGKMDERFNKAEDFDYILTSAKRGFFLKRLDIVIAKHNTVDYNHPARLWRMLSGQVYIRSLLYRKHFFNKHLWAQFARREYTLICLLICMVMFVFFQSYLVLLLYVFVIAFKSITQKNRPLHEFFLRLPYYPLRDIVTLAGFFLFHPRKPKNIKYEQIK